MDDEPFCDEDEVSCFDCPECGIELDEDDTCWNPECPACGEEPLSQMSDWQVRQHERRQMGVGL